MLQTAEQERLSVVPQTMCYVEVDMGKEKTWEFLYNMGHMRESLIIYIN